jgi:uncharacterized protein (TIGR00369 family)
MVETSIQELRDNKHCFVCGPENKSGLKLTFRMPEKGVMETEVIAEKRFQGFEGMFHGGMMCLLLDEIMVNLAWKMGLNAVTAELKVRLKRACRLGERFSLRARLVQEAKRLARLEATAVSEDGVLLAQAQSRCMKIKKKI